MEVVFFTYKDISLYWYEINLSTLFFQIKNSKKVLTKEEI
jgi:hypothetical protein